MPRKTKKVSPSEEIANAEALDKAAGVPPPVPLDVIRAAAGVPAPNARDEEIANVAAGILSEALTYDSREKLLLRHASKPWTDAFFEDFKETKELTALTCRLGARVLASIICSKDPEVVDVKDKIAAMRVILNIEYGQNASMDPEKFITPPPVATIPVGGTEQVDASLSKFRKLSGKR